MDIAEKARSILKKYGTAFLTWLLCAVSMSEVLYIYTDTPISIYTVASAAAAAGLIGLFDYLHTKKKLGGLVYAALLIAVCMVSPVIVGSGWENVGAFIRWFFSGAQAEDTQARFLLAIIPFMLYFLTSAFYYFTRIIYRPQMLVLVSLIPFALAVKTTVVFPIAYVMIIAPVNLIFCIIDGRKKLLNGKMSPGGSAATVYTDFAAAAVLLALIVPKPSETPYYDKFEAAVNMFSFGGSGETVYRGEYKTMSGNADELIRGESKLIYILSTPDPVYMKAQVFDIYDTASGKWISLGDGVSGSKSWQDRAGFLNYEKLGSAVKAASDKLTDSRFAFSDNMPELAEQESYSLVYSQDYAAQYVLGPLRATKADLSSIPGIEWCARSEAGEIFTNLDRAMLPPNASYTVRYYTEDTADTLIESGFCNVSFGEYKNFLNLLYAGLDRGSDEYAAVRELLRELWNAEEYKEETETEVSPEIQSLADELTEGLEYDWQKAYAIEQHFHTGGFTYNLGYIPPEGMDTPEYFLFESKTGICTDFATAYTLLARAAGLTVRYAEGFVPVHTGDNAMTYSIFTDNAHAYPEVYIPGAGWVLYEPTPASLTAGGRNDGGNADLDYTAVFLTAIAAVFGFGAFLLIVAMTPWLAERLFRIKAVRTGGGKGVVMLYNRYVRKAEKRFSADLKAFTPEQTAVFAAEKTGGDIRPLAEPFINACYGGAETNKADFEKAYECYKAQAKAMRKNSKRRNKL